MLAALGNQAIRWVSLTPWPSRSYAVARTLLAVAAIATLSGNDGGTLFPIRSSVCAEAESISIFCLVPDVWLETTRWSCVAIMCVAATGLFPRYTGIAQWWVLHSVAATGRTLDGGDQLAANLALFLVPVTIADTRRSHWRGRVFAGTGGIVNFSVGLFGLSCLVAIRVQMALVYFEATAGKVLQRQWRDGTAMYYWLTDPMYSLPPFVRECLEPLLRNRSLVATLTWGVIGLEAFLVAGLFLRGRSRSVLLCLGVVLHVLIGVVLGLPSFSLVMIAGLALYLWDGSDRRDSGGTPNAGRAERPT